MTTKAKRWRGQHFLTDKNMLKKIVSAAAIQPDDIVVEIGAGTGNLTVLLAEKAKRVIAIEIDSDLIPTLRRRIAQVCHSGEGRNPVVEIVHDDARTFNPANYGLGDVSYSVVANIPYNITSFIIRRLLETDPPPSRMILLVQKEVAQRICATPPHMSLLSVAVQYYATSRILFSVPRTCFSPRPRVDSAVVSFVSKNGDSHLFYEEETYQQYKKGGCPRFFKKGGCPRFFVIVSTGFAHKRKLLASNLVDGLGTSRERIAAIFKNLDFSPTARAQELSLGQWKELCSALFPFTRQ